MRNDGIVRGHCQSKYYSNIQFWDNFNHLCWGSSTNIAYHIIEWNNRNMESFRGEQSKLGYLYIYAAAGTMRHDRRI